MTSEPDKTISFKNMGFSYNPGHPVIRDFTLTVPSGKKVALVAPPAAEKLPLSTF